MKQSVAKSGPRKEKQNKQGRRAEHSRDNSSESPAERRRANEQEGMHSWFQFIRRMQCSEHWSDLRPRLQEPIGRRGRATTGTSVLCKTELLMNDLWEMERETNNNNNH